MDTTAILFVVAGGLAVGDWAAVATGRTRVEYVCKPATLAALVAAAVVADLDAAVHWWVVAALALGLAGDVALMLCADSADRWFLVGLAAFLLGHAAYIVAFLRYGVQGWQVLAGALVAVGVGGLALPGAIRGAVRQQGREFGLLVACYAVVIAVMAAAAAGTTRVPTAIGGALFVVSDAVLSRERFVGKAVLGRIPVGELAVIVTYHAAQALILLGLLGESWAQV